MRKNYLWYQFFRYGIIRPSLYFFYSDVTVNNREGIPEDKPVMFVANHQNSFLDALHITNNTRHIVHFLSRAEAFGNPVLDRFFYSLNMLPVYRARDGFGTIKQNKQIFEKCYQRLRQNDALLVFAEASHKMVRRVRPLSKGFTRIVFGAENKYNWELDLQIVPVGVNYGDHRKSRTPVHVEFGEAVSAKDYRNIFTEDERGAAHQLKIDIANNLKKLTLHISDKNHYPLHKLMLDELEYNREELLIPGLVNQRSESINNHLNGELVDEAEFLLEKAKEYNVDIQDVVNPPAAGLSDVIISPIYILSLINNALPYQVVRWLVDSYLEDEAFESSVKFLVGLLLPVYYSFVALILLLAGASLPVAIGYGLFSLATAPFFVRGKDLFLSKWVGKRKRSKLLNNDEFTRSLEKFKKLRGELFNNPQKKQ